MFPYKISNYFSIPEYKHADNSLYTFKFTRERSLYRDRIHASITKVSTMAYYAELYHDVTLEYNRRFFPDNYYGEDWRASPLEYTAYGFQFLKCTGKCEGKCTCFERQDLITQPLVIASDGGLRDWRTWRIEVPVAGMGVFVGAGSRYNVSEILPLDDYFEPNSSLVEIEAATRAVETAMRIKDDGCLPEVRVIILKTDSLRDVSALKSFRKSPRTLTFVFLSSWLVGQANVQ